MSSFTFAESLCLHWQTTAPGLTSAVKTWYYSTYLFAENSRVKIFLSRILESEDERI